MALSGNMSIRTRLLIKPWKVNIHNYYSTMYGFNTDKIVSISESA